MEKVEGIEININVCHESLESTKRTIENLLGRFPVEIDGDAIDLEFIKDSIFSDDYVVVASVGSKLLNDIEKEYNIELIDVTGCDAADVEYEAVGNEQ